MMRDSLPTASMFISGTTNGTSLSIRHADELSITVVPTSANIGAYFLDAVAPAENIAKSGFRPTTSSTRSTVNWRPAKSIRFPTDLSDAATSTSSPPNPLSSSTFSITPPTSPVAPTTAIFIAYYI